MTAFPRRLTALLALALSSGTGCMALDLGFDPPERDPFFEPEEFPVEVDVGACTDHVSAVSVGDHLTIAYEAEDALVPLIGTVNQVRGLAAELELRWWWLILAPETPLLPEGWEHDGRGTYVRQSGLEDQTRIEVRFYDGAQLVVPDLFHMSSYLVDPRTVPSEDGEDNLLFHVGPGPLVQMLGLGPDPASPVVFDDTDDFALQQFLERLRVEATIHVHTSPGEATFDYELEIPQTPIGDVAFFDPLELDLVELTARRDDPIVLGRATHWSIDQIAIPAFLGSTWGLEGEIELWFDGAFDFRARYDWEESVEPTIEIRCR